MVIQLTDEYGRQVRCMNNISMDMELNDGDRDFEITMPAGEYDSRIHAGCMIFAAGTEIGGIIGTEETDTKTDSLIYSGYTWRGRMEKKIIVPPAGQDYYTVSGELNDVLRGLIEPQFSGIFRVPDVDTGVTVNSYKFDRFCTLLSGLEKMLKSVGYRIDISYNEGEPNGSGWVDVQAVPIVDYSSEIELSQDSRLNFRMTDKRDGVNHLVIGGKGELQDRNVIHLYVQKDGSIGKTPYYTGIDEITEFYENTSAETDDVENRGKEQLQKAMNRKTFEMDIEQLCIDVQIGDIVGGRDYITGMSMAKPVENVIIKISEGEVSKEYKLEGTT